MYSQHQLLYCPRMCLRSRLLGASQCLSIVLSIAKVRRKVSTIVDQGEDRDT